MQALTFSLQDGWDGSKGFIKREVPITAIKEPDEAEYVIVKMRFAGVCGTDRGIWFRQTFKDAIYDSLAKEKKEVRVMGHEGFGEIVAQGSRVEEKYGFRAGDTVSAESHITCGRCFQCHHGELHVCTEEKILGISQDGIFAEYAKLPAKILWATDPMKIRPEIACLQEPFGNAVHACAKTDLKGKKLAIFGCGPIGLFSVLIARAFGAASIIAVDPSPDRTSLAKMLGADFVINLGAASKNNPWESDKDTLKAIYDYTKGLGADVAMEMAGCNSSVNNVLQCVRRGGQVILFGLKSGDFTIQEFDRIVVRRGLTLSAVIGRYIFNSWYMTKGLLENKTNKIQDKIWTILLKEGKDTVVPFSAYNPEQFEQQLLANPKIIIKF